MHDDAFYVPKELFEHWAERDPLERYRTWLRDHADFTAEEEDELRVHVKKLLNDALERAEASALPDPATLTEGRVRDARGPRHASPQVACRRRRTCKRSATVSARRCGATSGSS